MLIDTHCHINMMVKKKFDVPLTAKQIADAAPIVHAARQSDVTQIVNIGTSIAESYNCIALAKQYSSVYAAIGIHPNDCTSDWKKEIAELRTMLTKKEDNKIVAIGEIGLDMHYPDYNLQRQKDAFRAQIELALEHKIALVIHTRDARDETLRTLEEYADQITRGIIHCYSEDHAFADQVIKWNFTLGLGGIITYPKNKYLRDIARSVSLENIVLETDAPFLPPQIIRGKQNNPAQIWIIAEYLSSLREETFDHIAITTSQNAGKIFGLNPL